MGRGDKIQGIRRELPRQRDVIEEFLDTVTDPDVGEAQGTVRAETSTAP